MKRLALAVALLALCHSCLAEVDDAYTKCLLHLDTSISDEGGYTWQANGTAAATSTAAKFGAGSCFFSGSPTSIYAPATSSLDFGTGDFAADLWVQFGAVPDNDHIIGDHLAGSYGEWAIALTSGNLDVYVQNTKIISAPWSPATGTWYHLALTRSGDDIRVFVDGSPVASASSSADITSVYGISVGGDINGSLPFSGYSDEVRISIGDSRWVATFTPPAAPYGPTPSVPAAVLSFAPGGSLSVTNSFTYAGAPDASAVALLHFDGSALDESGSAWTSYGGLDIATDSKFGSGARSQVATNSYLQAFDSAAWNWPASWTVDCWICPDYIPAPTGVNYSVGVVWSQSFGSAPQHYCALLALPGSIKASYSASWEPAATVGDLTLATGTWTHIAWVNDSVKIRIYQDGVEIADDFVSGMPIDIAQPATIGSVVVSGADPWQFRMDELRVSKDVARWTGPFTPPTEAYGQRRSAAINWR